jgi:hypothetical protein
MKKKYKYIKFHSIYVYAEEEIATAMIVIRAGLQARTACHNLLLQSS